MAADLGLQLVELLRQRGYLRGLPARLPPQLGNHSFEVAARVAIGGQHQPTVGAALTVTTRQDGNDPLLESAPNIGPHGGSQLWRRVPTKGWSPDGYVGSMHSTRVYRHLNASRPAVYRALLDADAIATWRVPAGMSSQVHEFEAREGGSFRVSLTYDTPDGTGKSAPHTDTYHGHFLKLVPNELVVEVFEFETADPALRGTMTMTTTLTDADGGTDVLVVHEGIPDSVPAADNETGTRMALANLALLVEANERSW